MAAAEKFLSITDTLSKAVQKKSPCASQARKMAEVTISSLKDHRSDACFKKFWDETKQKASDLGVDEPVLPRKRRAPSHFDETASNTHHHETVDIP